MHSEDGNVDRALEAFSKGEFVMVMDRFDRENECDLILAAEFCTPEKMAFMIEHSTGIVCVVTDQDRLESLGLYPAALGGNTDKNSTNFYVSTDYLPTTTTGVSAFDRCETVRAFCTDKEPSHFSKPGHMFPLCARPNGLADRDGHTESAYDLCRLTGLQRVAIIGELMNRKGEMMRMDESLAFAKAWGDIPLITVPELKQVSQLRLIPSPRVFPRCKIAVKHVSEECALYVFPSLTGDEIAVLVKGSVLGRSNVSTRIHSECLTGDVLGSLRCDCGDQLTQFLKNVLNGADCGILIYMKGHEGRGIGLGNKVRCYHAQDELGLDTIDANLQLGFAEDGREFATCCEILKQLQVVSVDLYTNNVSKGNAIGAYCARMIPLSSTPNGINDKYLLTKQTRMKHKTVIDTMNWENVCPPEETDHFTVGIVSAVWNEEYLDSVRNSCVEFLRLSGNTVVEVSVPGALDLIAGAKYMKNIDAIICIGVLIKGETDVYSHSCEAVANGLSQLNTLPGMPPVISGVVMYKSETQASERLDTDAEKMGTSWAKNALAMARLTQKKTH